MKTVHHRPDTRPRIGVYRRVSTRHQLENDRYLRAIEDMTSVMERHNAEIVIYDEGGIARSGGTIRGRKVFEAMLADVKSGEIDGIAAPDVRSLSRGEWLIDGKTIADIVIHANALIFTRYNRLDLRNHGDLKSFRDELFYAMKEKDEIRQRMYEGQAARALNVADGRERPWGRHRTMLGHMLEVLLDERGQPRITNRGVIKRAWAKDPAVAQHMETLIAEMNRQPTRGALFAALYAAKVPSPGSGGWTKRDLRTLLNSPHHRGRWSLVRNPKATIWYGLDPRSEAFDVSKVGRDCPELAYWTPAQARRWEERFVSSDDRTRRSRAGCLTHAHPLLLLLRCPQCHRFLIGKGKFGYICPEGAKATKSYRPTCMPIFTVRQSTAEAALRDLLPLIEPRLMELRDAARASLKRRNSGGLDVRLTTLANEERALLATQQRMIEQNLPLPESIGDRFIEIAKERRDTLAEQDAADKIAGARVEAEQALSTLKQGDLIKVVGRLDAVAYAETLKAFFAWVEVKSRGAGHVGGELVDHAFHNQRESGPSSLMERLAFLFAA